MQLFISWSGDRSHRLAIAMNVWLEHQFPGQIEAFVSSDIEKGTQWFPAVRRLRDAARRRRRRDRHQARGQRRRAVLAAPRPVAEGRRRPGARPSAVEEILRYLPPSQYQGRFSVEDRAFEGGTIPAGHPVLLITAPPPATRGVRAPPTTSTSSGPPTSPSASATVHACLGAALARMESRIAIEEIARRWQRLEIDEAGLRRVHMSNVAGTPTSRSTPSPASGPPRARRGRRAPAS